MVVIRGGAGTSLELMNLFVVPSLGSMDEGVSVVHLVMCTMVMLAPWWGVTMPLWSPL